MAMHAPAQLGLNGSNNARASFAAQEENRNDCRGRGAILGFAGAFFCCFFLFFWFIFLFEEFGTVDASHQDR